MKILFLCTGNSCRSILSEALFNAQAPTGFQACSAGSHPSGQIHPLTLKTLQSLNLATENLFSKNMQACEEFAPEIVVTVCSEAANETCPLYLGNALKVHWGLDDPSHLDLPEAVKLQAFNSTVQHIQRRLKAFFALNFENLNAQELVKALEKIALIA